MPRLLWITTGGTIASTPTAQGLAPAQDGQALLSFLPPLPADCGITIHDLFQVDSTDMTTAMRQTLARHIWQHRDAYDGFLVTHGTDTLAYTAAFLARALPSFSKPVVITGAQEPITAPNTDAIRNLSDAIAVACAPYFGVAVVFCGRILRGTHAYKYDTKAYDGFRAIDIPDDGSVAHGDVTLVNAPAFPQGAPSFCGDVLQRVGVLTLHPDFAVALLHHYAVYDAVILRTYGSGGVPADLEAGVQALIKAGTRVYLLSQCLAGGLALTRYAVGARAQQAGALPLKNATLEDAIAMLMCENTASKTETSVVAAAND